MQRVDVEVSEEGEGLLAGEVAIEVRTRTGTKRVSLDLPPGAPRRPPTAEELREKLVACGGSLAPALQEATFEAAIDLLAG